MINRFKKTIAFGVMAAMSAAPSFGAAAADTIKIAYIDPLSGPFANVGDAGFKHFLYIARKINAEGGINGKEIEMVPFDNKSSPQESLLVLRDVIDQGIQYITQGNGSHVAGALIDAVEKHNQRNADQPMMFMNYAAVSPDFTNDQCSFGHFRFDAHAGMKLNAMTDYMAEQEDIKKVYLINMDYEHGHQVSRITKEMLKEKRPDIEIVGDVLHPIGKVKDFAPYVSKIQASGADTIVTGNWGNDLSLLVKAAAAAGLDADYYTFYAGGLGTPTAIGNAGNGRVYQVTEWHENLPIEENTPAMAEFAAGFEEQYQLDWYYNRMDTQLKMLKAAMEKAGSTDPIKVGKAMEGMQYNTPYGMVTMRAQDHQLLQPLYISVLTDDVKNDVENTGLGFKTVAKIPAEQTATPSSCEMKRPS